MSIVKTLFAGFRGLEMKFTIRVMLILASLCMVLANVKMGMFALAASLLFLLANLSSLVYNIVRKKP